MNDAPERIMVSACGKVIVTDKKAFPTDVEYIRADTYKAAEARIAELEGDTDDGSDTLEFLRSSCRDIVTGDPLEPTARPDIYVHDVRVVAEEYAAMRDRITKLGAALRRLYADWGKEFHRAEAVEARIVELEAALERIERLARLVGSDLVGRVESGKVEAVHNCSRIARTALGEKKDD